MNISSSRLQIRQICWLKSIIFNGILLALFTGLASLILAIKNNNTSENKAFILKHCELVN